MALNFGLLDPDAPTKIANSLYAGQQERQKNMMAQQQMQAGAQQLETGRLQQQHSQMQMDQMIRDRDALAKLQQQFVANGKSPDLEVNADAMIQSGISHYVDIGFQLKQKLMDQKRYAAIMGGEPANAAPPAAPVVPAAAPVVPAAAPAAAPAAPAGTPLFPSFEPAPGVPIKQGFSSGTVITTLDGQGNVVADNQLANKSSQANQIAAQIKDYNDKYKAAQNITSNNMAPVAAPVADQLAFAPNPAAANIEILRRQRNALLAMGTPQAVAAARALDADIAIASKEPVYHNVPGVGLVDPRAGKIIVAEQDKATELQRNFEYAKGQGFKGNIFDYEKALREAGRAPAQPRAEPAPTIAQIIDPTNPSQMITIDAKRYQGGGAGSVGVIGVSGKEPGAALRVNKVEEGKSQLANDLDNLRSSFSELDRLRAIPSTERNVLSNIMSATAASGVGQAMNRAGGSPEQVERDVINSARQRLVSSIKNATGMSSRSLDSNVELQTMLRSISDPGQSIEAALRIIDDIENAYVKGAGMPKKNAPGGGAPAAAPGKPAAPSVGTIQDGYRFKGGNPADKANWEKQ